MHVTRENASAFKTAPVTPHTPRRSSAAISAVATVVLLTPLCVPAITSRGMSIRSIDT